MKNIKKYVSISAGNIKLGGIPNISLPPVKSCADDVPCIGDCYALRSYNQYPVVRHAWNKNLYTSTVSLRLYEACVTKWIEHHKPPYFRWHVAGDITTAKYRNMIIKIAKRYTSVKFMVFTKRYKFFTNRIVIPENLKVILSAWPGLDIPKSDKYSIAWMDDGTDDRIPKDAIECSGHCDSCLLCWNHKGNKQIRFPKH